MNYKYEVLCIDIVKYSEIVLQAKYFTLPGRREMFKEHLIS